MPFCLSLLLALVLLRTNLVASQVAFLAACRAIRRSLLLGDGGLSLLESQRARRLEEATALLLIFQLRPCLVVGRVGFGNVFVLAGALITDLVGLVVFSIVVAVFIDDVRLVFLVLVLFVLVLKVVRFLWEPLLALELALAGPLCLAFVPGAMREVPLFADVDIVEVSPQSPDEGLRLELVSTTMVTSFRWSSFSRAPSSKK